MRDTASATSAVPRCAASPCWLRSTCWRRWRPRRRDSIRPPLEGLGKAAERGVEHRAHQQPQRTALEFVRDEELDLALRVAERAKRPMIVKPAERTVEIFHVDLQARTVDRHPHGK